MGGGLEQSPPSTSHTKLFEKAFPQYLAMGMSYELFYDVDCCLVLAYRSANRIRMRQKNDELWLQGFYFYEALCAVSPILHAFAEKGTRAKPYISEPVVLSADEQLKREEREEAERYERMKSKMLAWTKYKKED